MYKHQASYRAAHLVARRNWQALIAQQLPVTRKRQLTKFVEIIDKSEPDCCLNCARSRHWINANSALIGQSNSQRFDTDCLIVMQKKVPQVV